MTAVKDPLYREIEKRLSEGLDPVVFERCAVELLRPVYPGLVPVCGGDDAGMDGAISEPPGGPPVPLVCTTAVNVIGNLTKSLESYRKSGGESQEAVLVTSQALTARKRRNLERRAEEKGFELRNIHDRNDLTGRLYRHPAWRRELLGPTGDLPALSVYSRLHNPRHEADRTLVGRDEAASWVRAQRDDFVLVGQPGVGKRSLLRLLAQEGRGLFVVTNDLARIADGCRAERPEFLLLEDAHLLAKDSHSHSDLLSAICRMRWEIGASFKVAATTWTWPDRRVEDAIGPAAATKKIRSLSRPDTAKIVRSVAPKLPENGVAEIVDQSECRPGLAATLAEHVGAVADAATRAGPASELGVPSAASRLADGQLLLNHLRQSCTSGGLTGRDLDVLAVFALAGSTGVALARVADALQEGEASVSQALSKVAPTGIIKDRGIIIKNRGHYLAIVNPALRAALVARTFFRGPWSLSVREHLSAMPDPRTATETLIDALARGASVSHELIQSRLPNDATQGPDRELWQRYAGTGKTAVKWIVHAHPRQIPNVALCALRTLPTTVLSKLISAMSSQDESVPSSTHHDGLLVGRDTHPALSAIQDWIREPTPNTVRRRQWLFDTLASSFEGSQQPPMDLHRTVASLVPLVFSLRLYALDPDPIKLGTFRFDIRGLSPDHVEQIHALWKLSADLLRKANALDTARRIAQSWATAPRRLGRGLPSQTAKVVQDLAAGMITDMVRWSDGRPGVVLWAKQIAAECKVHVAGLPATPSDLEELFGIRPDASTRDRDRAVRLVAEKLADRPAAAGVDRLLRYQEEARVTLFKGTALRTVEKVVHHIAERTQEPSAWVIALASRQTDVHWMRPFVDTMLAKGRGCEEGWRALLDCNEYRDVVVQSAIYWSRVPEDVVAYILERMADPDAMPGVVDWKDVPNTWKERMLTHENRRVAVVAACEMYREYQNHDPKLLTLSRTARTSWRSAIVESDDETVLAFAMEHHPDVAKAWFLSPDRRLPAEPGEVSMSDIADHMLHGLGQPGSTGSPTQAASVLDSDAKLQLVRAMPASTDPRAFVALVGRDPTLYKEFLSRRDLGPMHLAPLADREPSPTLAIAALDHGYSPEDIAKRIATWTESYQVFVDFPEFRTVEEMRDPAAEWFPEPPVVARHHALEWERHPNPAVRQIYRLVMEMELQ